MSALMTRRRRTAARDRDHGQASLFSQIVSPPAPPAPAALRDAAPAPARVVEERADATVGLEARPEPASPIGLAEPSPGAVMPELSLEDLVTGLWGDLIAGEVADCPVCGDAMEPRHSAGAGVVGGRCTSCATTIA